MVLEEFPEGHINKYHKNVEENRDNPSYFEFEIKLNEKYYSYGFEAILNKSSIVSEWLVELSPDGNDNEIFTREVLQSEYKIDKYFKDKRIVERLNIYAEDTKSDDSILFLNVMNKNKSNLYETNNVLSVFKEIYDWIKYSLDINYPDRPISNYSYFTTEKNEAEICQIISAFGTGISNFKVVDMSMEKMPESLPKPLLKNIVSKFEKQNKAITKSPKENSFGIMLRGYKDFYIFEIDEKGEISIKTIEFEHSNSSALFTLSEESDGTRMLLDLIEVLLASNSGKTYVIDEIDRCLHPQLTYKLIESYLNISKEHQRLYFCLYFSSLTC